MDNEYNLYLQEIPERKDNQEKSQEQQLKNGQAENDNSLSKAALISYLLS